MKLLILLWLFGAPGLILLIAKVWALATVVEVLDFNDKKKG